MEQQVQLLTRNIFEMIFNREKHIITSLKSEGGYIYPLMYPGHKWKFTEGGEINFCLSALSVKSFHSTNFSM